MSLQTIERLVLVEGSCSVCAQRLHQRHTATGASGVGGSVLAAAVTAVRPRIMAIVLIISTCSFLAILVRVFALVGGRANHTLFFYNVKRKFCKK